MEGSKFCILHAPIEEKEDRIEEFWDVFEEHINSEKEIIDCRGIEFPPLEDRLSKREYEPILIFDDAVFNGLANFYGAIFNKKSVFRNVTFKETAKFRKATFKEGATFEKSVFLGRADFTGSIFIEDAFFSGTSFCEKAEFIRTEFRGVTYFEGTNTKENLFFTNSRIGITLY